MTRLLAVLVAAVVLGALAATAAGQNPPVSITVGAPSVAPRGIPVQMSVAVAADPGALTYRATGPAPLWIRMRLARECGATFESTTGQVVLNRKLRPKPRAHVAYRHTFRVARRLQKFGTWTACAFLEEQGDDRLWAFDADTQIDVTRHCTRLARRAIDQHRRRARHAC